MREPEQRAFPAELPLLALPGRVVFPGARASLEIGSPPEIELADAALANNRLLALLPLNEVTDHDLPDSLLPRRGSVARIARMNRMENGSIHLVVQGIARAEICGFLRKKPFPIAQLAGVEERDGHELHVEALRRNSIGLLRRVTQDEGLLLAAENTGDGGRFSDLVAAGLPISFDEKYSLLQEDDVEKRMEETGRILEREGKLRTLEANIKKRVTSELGREERDRYLRRQIASIREELGEEDERSSQVRELRRRLTDAKLPEAVMSLAGEEISRLARTPVQSGEFVVSRNHIDWILSLPWKDRSHESIDMEEARAVLDRNHFGLEKIKERILEFLAVRKLRADARSPFLCFIGPPGVGKTSMGLAIAEALGRQVAHVSLGGVTDDGEIRGHRMTYTGALPGRILQELRRVGVRNPVFMLDEIDKVGSEFRGDPAASLLEVLDPEQNRIFFDHYLNLPFDLSDVFFIATSNSVDAIPPGLLDRMEMVRFPGYTSTEKVAITRQHLLPRQLKEHGLPKRAIQFKVDAIRRILSEYAIEAGLRDLDRSIATICRKRAVRWLDGEREKTAVSKEDIPDYLGFPVYFPEVKRGMSEVGIATTLAWTPTGGEILFIEALLMPGCRSLQLTGHLGEVMRESAETALSFVRHFIQQIGAPRELIDESDIHLHVPAGAIPKDGPSAGVGLATALFSLLSGRPVRNDIAMTGEITLRGVVLPVAGLKEKIFGAHRAGIREVILPAKNAAELAEIPDEIIRSMKFHAVERVEAVFDLACIDAPKEGD